MISKGSYNFCSSPIEHRPTSVMLKGTLGPPAKDFAFPAPKQTNKQDQSISLHLASLHKPQLRETLGPGSLRLGAMYHPRSCGSERVWFCIAKFTLRAMACSLRCGQHMALQQHLSPLRSQRSFRLCVMQFRFQSGR